MGVSRVVCVFFGGRAGSDVNTGHTFLQRSELAAVTWWEAGLEVKGLESGVRERASPPLSCPQGWGQVSCCWSRSPEGQVQAGSGSFQCVLLFLPALSFTPAGSSAGARGAQWVLGEG